ncbi:MAG: DUF3800 domain-containing protein [Rhodanobacter sp.]|jgi:hypothetical protein
MSITIQADDFRDGMPALRNWNSPLCIYYDETNNIRRLSLSEVGLNAPADQTFAIAGIALRSGQAMSGWEELRRAMRIQSSATEVKFKHIAPPDYEGALASRKLSNVLTWLIDNDVLIHYSVLDVLYWSVLDIVESLMPDDRLAIIPIHLELKNELHHAVCANPQAFVSLLHSFAYPNLERSHVEPFLEAVLTYMKANVPEDRNIATPMLRQTLRHAMRLPDLELPLLHDNEPGELIRDLSHHFMHCMYVFKHASHTFDRETYVEKALQSFEIHDGEKRLDYRFTDSKGEVGIQVSDVVTGLLGRHFTYLQNHTLPELRRVYRILCKRSLSYR